MSVDDGFRFDELQQALFKTLVIDKLGLVGSADYKSGPSARILVMIRPGKVEIQPASDTRHDGNVYWRPPEVVDSATLTQLKFISFFDWNEFGAIDMALVKCFEPKKPRTVLVAQHECEFLVEP